MSTRFAPPFPRRHEPRLTFIETNDRLQALLKAPHVSGPTWDLVLKKIKQNRDLNPLPIRTTGATRS